MAVMIAKALGLSASATSGNGFADERNIPLWAHGAVTGVKQLGVVEGKGANTFDPAGLLTRAEAVTVQVDIGICQRYFRGTEFEGYELKRVQVPFLYFDGVVPVRLLKVRLK
ncbi:S-layer homology domain-containing protein [Gorillibacterium massiliense]|uniref:S-layer homology domain-containing protein n=1 Tax=Gorillibacterium massiliense TaxID=1280390 RepID=UPI00059379F2|nr:S-layer homology domain-containing protein [Gorillibacterium massiliense]